MCIMVQKISKIPRRGTLEMNCPKFVSETSKISSPTIGLLQEDLQKFSAMSARYNALGMIRANGLSDLSEVIQLNAVVQSQ